MVEEQHSNEKGPLPRTREAVDWWLRKWGRQAAISGKESLNGDDVLKLIEINGGSGDGLYLVGRDLQGLELPGATDLHGADLRKTNLKGSVLRQVNFQDVRLEGANLQNIDLFESNLKDADLQGVNLKGARLWKVNFQSANLWIANLESADLFSADLRGTNLRAANLKDANLSMIFVSPDTDLERVMWDKNYVSVLERNGDYEAAIDLYRRLKEWYRGAGILKIAGEFHYREEEAITKARGQQLWSEFKQIGSEFREFKRSLKAAWQQLKRKDADTQLKE